MSAIKIGEDLIHYEVLGRGRPIILVHGWLGCWRYWIPTMQTLHLKYRVYALDLYGFGDSVKNAQKYSLDEQVNLMDAFMNEMAIAKTALVGHGLGALVVAEYARRHSDKVARLLTVSTPLYDTGDLDTRPHAERLVPLTANTPQTAAAAASHSDFVPGELTQPSASTAMRRLLEEAARARANGELPPKLPDLAELAAESLEPIPSPVPAPVTQKTDSKMNLLKQQLGDVNLKGLLAKCFKSSEPEYGKLQVDVEKTDAAVLKKSLDSYDAGRVIDTFLLLAMPIMLIHGEDDEFIRQPPANVWDRLTKKENTAVFSLDGVRHFPMLEDDRFNRLLNEFLEVPDITKIETKERWKRRTR